MNFWYDLVLKLAPIIVTALVSFISGRATKKLDDIDKTEKEAMNNMSALKLGVTELLRLQIIQYHDKYMAEGRIPLYALDNFNELYGAYHALGGNGAGQHMADEVRHLPTSENKH